MHWLYIKKEEYKNHFSLIHRSRFLSIFASEKQSKYFYAILQMQKPLIIANFFMPLFVLLYIIYKAFPYVYICCWKSNTLSSSWNCKNPKNIFRTLIKTASTSGHPPCCSVSFLSTILPSLVKGPAPGINKRWCPSHTRFCLISPDSHRQ